MTDAPMSDRMVLFVVIAELMNSLIAAGALTDADADQAIENAAHRLARQPEAEASMALLRNMRRGFRT
jgi:hypothetical protein